MEIAAIIFVLVMIAIAFIAFKLLKHTMKMAFRMIVFLVLLLIAIAGAFALWNSGYFS